MSEDGAKTPLTSLGHVDLDDLGEDLELDQSGLAPLADRELCQGHGDLEMRSEDADIEFSRPQPLSPAFVEKHSNVVKHRDRFIRPIETNHRIDLARRRRKWIILCATAIVLIVSFIGLSHLVIKFRLRDFLHAGAAIGREVEKTAQTPNEQNIIDVANRLARQEGLQVLSLKVIVDPRHQSPHIDKIVGTTPTRAMADGARWVIGFKAQLATQFGLIKRTFNVERFGYLPRFDAPHPGDEALEDEELRNPF